MGKTEDLMMVRETKVASENGKVLSSNKSYEWVRVFLD